MPNTDRRQDEPDDNRHALPVHQLSPERQPGRAAEHEPAHRGQEGDHRGQAAQMSAVLQVIRTGRQATQAHENPYG